jgi:hypothetical protein
LDREGGINMATWNDGGLMLGRIRSIVSDESGLVAAMEMTVGIMLSFVLIISAVLLIMYALMGTMVDDAALVSARAATQFQFPLQASQASTVAKEVFAKAIPQSTQTQCAPLATTVPVKAGQSFAVSSVCTVNLGTFLGVRIGTTWTASASVPVEQVGN